MESADSTPPVDSVDEAVAAFAREVHRLGRRVAPDPWLDQVAPERRAEARERMHAVLEGLRPKAGTVLGDFRLIRRLGEGGMGEVWEAEQSSLGRRVALKLVSPGVLASPRRLERFFREAQAAGRLTHEAIVPVFGHGEADGQPYIVQQLIPGGRTLAHELAELRRRHGVPPGHDRRVARLAATVATALQVVHDAGMVHRDVKPSNVLLWPDGRPVLADFGLARTPAAATITWPGCLAGTRLYMAPEQRTGAHEVDGKADVYSLGVVLFEALTLAAIPEGEDSGREGGDLASLLSAGRTDPRIVRPGVPDELAAIVRRALEPHPADRYPSARALAEDLEAWLSHRPVQAIRPTPLYVLRKAAHRHPVRSALLAAGMVVLAVAGVSLQRIHDANLSRRLEQAATARGDAARLLEQDELLAASLRFQDALQERSWIGRADIEAQRQVLDLLHALISAGAADASLALLADLLPGATPGFRRELQLAQAWALAARGDLHASVQALEVQGQYPGLLDRLRPLVQATFLSEVVPRTPGNRYLEAAFADLDRDMREELWVLAGLETARDGVSMRLHLQRWDLAGKEPEFTCRDDLEVPYRGKPSQALRCTLHTPGDRSRLLLVAGPNRQAPAEVRNWTWVVSRLEAPSADPGSWEIHSGFDRLPSSDIQAVASAGDLVAIGSAYPARGIWILDRALQPVTPEPLDPGSLDILSLDFAKDEADQTRLLVACGDQTRFCLRQAIRNDRGRWSWGADLLVRTDTELRLAPLDPPRSWFLLLGDRFEQAPEGLPEPPPAVQILPAPAFRPVPLPGPQPWRRPGCLRIGGSQRLGRNGVLLSTTTLLPPCQGGAATATQAWLGAWEEGVWLLASIPDKSLLPALTGDLDGDGRTEVLLPGDHGTLVLGAGDRPADGLLGHLFGSRAAKRPSWGSLLVSWLSPPREAEGWRALLCQTLQSPMGGRLADGLARRGPPREVLPETWRLWQREAALLAGRNRSFLDAGGQLDTEAGAGLLLPPGAHKALVRASTATGGRLLDWGGFPDPGGESPVGLRGRWHAEPQSRLQLLRSKALAEPWPPLPDGRTPGALLLELPYSQRTSLTWTPSVLPPSGHPWRLTLCFSMERMDYACSADILFPFAAARAHEAGYSNGRWKQDGEGLGVRLKRNRTNSGLGDELYIGPLIPRGPWRQAWTLRPEPRRLLQGILLRFELICLPDPGVLVARLRRAVDPADLPDLWRTVLLWDPEDSIPAKPPLLPSPDLVLHREPNQDGTQEVPLSATLRIRRVLLEDLADPPGPLSSR